MRLRALVTVSAVLLATACARNDLTNATPNGGSASRTITPTGTLDDNIAAIFALFPKGLRTAGTSRWTTIKGKVASGQLSVAKSMLLELTQWVQDKGPGMDTPPNGETKTAAAARLTLYMSMYVYGSPTEPPPTYLPAADDAVGLVTPDQPATIVTPTTRAGVAIDQGSVGDGSIVVITENPTPYPDACSGPLQTKLCQYPRFYTFDIFPHVTLLKPARFAVCHVNAGDTRRPLEDHDGFRLAHTAPPNPADYTPGSTVRVSNGENVEILPLIHQTFSFCDDVEYALNSDPGIGASLRHLGKMLGQALTPKSAYAIDQGGGGMSETMSPFNDVDPPSQSDRQVQSVTTSSPTAHLGDHITVSYTVSNGGTATGASVPATIRLGSSATDPNAITLATVTIPALVPGQSFSPQAPVPVTIPATSTGRQIISLQLGDDPTFPDLNSQNDVGSALITIDNDFASMNRTMFVGDDHVCALTSANQMNCWGNNQDHNLGVTSPAQASSPFAPSTLQAPFVQLAYGHAQSTCAIKADRSATCWGRGGFGQLGGGVPGGLFNPPVTVLGGVLWNDISNARLSACGVSTSNVGYCWGSNQRGEVGSTEIPVQIPTANQPQISVTQPHIIDGGHAWRSVVAGWLHACGIDTNGDAWCWGDNARGQLGAGFIDSLPHQTPALVTGGQKWVQLSLGATYTCGISVDHTAYCWGENFTGQLGDGSTTRRSVPTAVSGSTKFSYIAAGTGFGDGTGIAVPTPPAAPQGAFAHTCALTEDGTAYCWGWNVSGQLGDGTTTDKLVPTQVAGPVQFTALGLGGGATCGRRGDQIMCWGGNVVGQLGNGTLASSAVPVVVGSPFGTP